MLLGTILHVSTDHKNLTHKLSSYTTQCVLHWHLLLEEYNPLFHFIPGPKIIVADALFCTPMFFQHFTSIPDNDSFLFSSTAKGLLALPLCDARTEHHPVDDSYSFYFTLNLTRVVAIRFIFKLYTIINKKTLLLGN